MRVQSVRDVDEAHITAIGELDIESVPLLAAEFEAAERGDAELIVLDLSGLTFVDSTGLRFLLGASDGCGGEGGRLRILEGSEPLERLLDIVGLRERLPIG